MAWVWFSSAFMLSLGMWLQSKRLPSDKVKSATSLEGPSGWRLSLVTIA